MDTSRVLVKLLRWSYYYTSTPAINNLTLINKLAYLMQELEF